MDVLIAGGHGKVALLLMRELHRRGHRPRGLIRNADHARDLEEAGGEPVLCDLEADDVGQHVGGADAIVFAAGAGPGSGPERKRTVDLGGALKCVRAAQELGVARFVIVSSMGTEDVAHAAEGMRPYLEAKAEADAAVEVSGLDWTIVRPGHLVDEPGTGRVDARVALGRRGDVPRADVALVIAECLEQPSAIRKRFELLAGDTPAAIAVRDLPDLPDLETGAPAPAA